ncbi:zinc finger protein 37-like [Scophthalmus maximus]|uniref:zinc finger protein 37-like n=1 Tax=Scophthalmus maximus TaxID=52904 RepID=UPI001FA8A351|nr:zinc finger protein 37-like [Scophthalmus maximus]
MSSVQHLREFISQRLTAAAEEILGVFVQTIVELEEEVARQSKLLDIVWTPEVKLRRIELPQHLVCEEEEVLTDQERNSSLDQEEPEPLQIKEEQAETCTSQKGEQLVLKQETDAFMLTPDCEDGDHREPEPGVDHQLLSHNSPVDEGHVVWKPDLKLQRIELPQHLVCEEEEVLTDQERNSSLDQEEPEPLQIKEEQEEICTSQDGEQLVLKQETDAFMLTPDCEDGDHREPDVDHQLLSHNSPAAESQDQEGREHVASGSTRNAESNAQRSLYETRSHRNNVYNSPTSTIGSKTHTEEKSFKCDICGKVFTTKPGLHNHMKIHTGEKPYLCKMCGKRFNNLSNMKRHMKTHTGEKPYSCSICGKRFSAFSDTKKHLRTHTGEKPYSCKTCGKSYARSSSLNVHIRSHTSEKPYSCSTCGKRFGYSSHRNRHERLHTG